MPERKLLDPKAVARLSNLQVKATAVVEGFLTGLHKSPYHGFSVEFSEHRQYMPGDPLKHLDYKVLGKTGRYYIKQFEEETNLKAYLLVDHSGSMGYGSKDVTKLDYATCLAASMSLLLLKQRDAVGLVTFEKTITSIMPPHSAQGWLEPLTKKLSEIEPQGETTVSDALLDIAERVKRRGLVILISDLLDDPQKIIAGLRALRHLGHEVMVFQVLDPLEKSFDFPRDAKFKDLETDQILPSRPWHIKDEYRQLISEFLESYRLAFRGERIDYYLFTTDIPYELALFEFLDRRGKLK